MTEIHNRIETQLIHAGAPNPLIEGAVSLPIFQSSTFESAGHTGYHDQRYIRLNNTPNHIVLHDKLAALEHGEDAVVAASGMAAISTTLLALLKPGDHILVQSCLYGGTHGFINGDMKALGISIDVIDGSRPERWAEKKRDNTRMIYVESISNPLMEVIDLKAAADFARANGLISVIDNTFATPFNFRPITLGYDISLHSCTKYLNGHSDILAGAVIGSADLLKTIKMKLNHLGACLDPHACFLLDRGMKTLAVRMKCHNENGMKLAEYLKEHPMVDRVYYPGLPETAGHHHAKAHFDGFGGMLAFEPKGGLEASQRCIKRLRLPISAPSLGGVESLVTRPVTTSHSGMSDDELAAAGITRSLIRFSAGIEAAEDLIADLDQALRT